MGGSALTPGIYAPLGPGEYLIEHLLSRPKINSCFCFQRPKFIDALWSANLFPIFRNSRFLLNGSTGRLATLLLNQWSILMVDLNGALDTKLVQVPSSPEMLLSNDLQFVTDLKTVLLLINLVIMLEKHELRGSQGCCWRRFPGR